MRFFLLPVGLLLGLLSLASALSAVGNSLLVVLDAIAEKTQYSQLWTDLEDRGFRLTFKSPKDTDLALFLHGEPAYSHLLLLPPKSKGLGPALTPNLLVNFLNAGANILLALSAEHVVPSAINSLLIELDIALPSDRNSLVVDHFSYDAESSNEKHDVLLIPSPVFRRGDIKNFFSVDGLIALPRTVGQVLGNASPLLLSILSAPSTAYIYNPKDEADTLDDPFATGAQISLVTAFQARNSARFTVLGSAEALEDVHFDSRIRLPGAGKKTEKSSNRAFARKLTGWAFQETGVLRVNQVTHFLNEGSQRNAIANSTSLSSIQDLDLNPNIYRIENSVHYSVSLSEWSEDHWAPFTLPSNDHLQLEFSMLSPFHRLNLNPSSSSSNETTYTASFTLPDQHGIFNFYLEYRRPFYTNVEEKRTVTVRHFAHNEWPRSFVISGAWPWIGGLWVTVLGWLGFVGLWLYSAPVQRKKDEKPGLAARRR